LLDAFSAYSLSRLIHIYWEGSRFWAVARAFALPLTGLRIRMGVSFLRHPVAVSARSPLIDLPQ